VNSVRSRRLGLTPLRLRDGWDVRCGDCRGCVCSFTSGPIPLPVLLVVLFPLLCLGVRLLRCLIRKVKFCSSGERDPLRLCWRVCPRPLSPVSGGWWFPCLNLVCCIDFRQVADSHVGLGHFSAGCLRKGYLFGGFFPFLLRPFCHD